MHNYIDKNISNKERIKGTWSFRSYSIEKKLTFTRNQWTNKKMNINEFKWSININTRIRIYIYIYKIRKGGRALRKRARRAARWVWTSWRAWAYAVGFSTLSTCILSESRSRSLRLDACPHSPLRMPASSQLATPSSTMSSTSRTIDDRTLRAPATCVRKIIPLLAVAPLSLFLDHGGHCRHDDGWLPDDIIQLRIILQWDAIRTSDDTRWTNVPAHFQSFSTTHSLLLPF